MAGLLIETKEQLLEHVSASSNIDVGKILPSVRRVERKYIKGVIGKAQYDVLLEYTDNDVSDPLYEVKQLFSEASACFAMVTALPLLNTSVTNSGIKSDRNEDTDKAAWYEVRDLMRSYYSTANEALDEALKVMEANLTAFPEWVESENYTVFKELIVQTTSQFNEGFFINNNRVVFLSLKPYMREVEEQYLKGMLGDCYSLFIQNSTEAAIKKAQGLARLAVVSLTIAKVCTAGNFLFTPTGITVYAEELPWDKNKNTLSQDQLDKLQADRQNSGEEYLKLLKKHILENAASFPCFTEKETAGLSDKILKKKSGLYL